MMTVAESRNNPTNCTVYILDNDETGYEVDLDIKDESGNSVSTLKMQHKIDYEEFFKCFWMLKIPKVYPTTRYSDFKELCFKYLAAVVKDYVNRA